jgi:ABC-type multidrug transport system ATPase subunit
MLKVGEAMELYGSFYGQPADAERLLDDLGLADKRDTSYGKLSGGQKQRLSIALALVGNPELAILDGLTTGLDPNARRDTWELVEQIRDRGVTVVPVTHLMEEAERLADRVALIDHGRLVAIDSPAGLVSRIDTEQRIRWCPGQRSLGDRGAGRGRGVSADPGGSPGADQADGQGDQGGRDEHGASRRHQGADRALVGLALPQVEEEAAGLAQNPHQQQTPRHPLDAAGVVGAVQVDEVDQRQHQQHPGMRVAGPEEPLAELPQPAAAGQEAQQRRATVFHRDQ